MDISMAGIDCTLAPVEVREAFAMTASAAVQAAQRVCREFGADGCVILSTCNRAELWVSGRIECSPYELFCALKGVDAPLYRGRFTERHGEQAVRHLFSLACGLRSQVFGEDQILTQVKNALALAREAKAADAVLETLFRAAVTAAKQVKTEVRLTAASRSVAASMIDFLKKKEVLHTDTPCLVIGNGEMGRLAAAGLAAAGCRVSMTVRQYRHGDVLVPAGVTVVPYSDRLCVLPQMRVVVSATTSPHYTLRAAQLGALAQPVIFCDLAVPRDIDPLIAGLENAQLFDTDMLCDESEARYDAKALAQANQILETHIGEFLTWCACRPYVPAVHSVSAFAAQDTAARLEKTVRGLGLEKDAATQLSQRICGAAERAFSHLLFELQRELPPDRWGEAVSSLHRVVQQEQPEQPEQPGFPAGAPVQKDETNQQSGAAAASENGDALYVLALRKLQAQSGPRVTCRPEAPAEQGGAAVDTVPRFPLFIDLSQCAALVFGGGKIAARRAASLKDFCKSVTVIAPFMDPALEALENEGSIRLLRRVFAPGDCAGFGLVVAATDNRVVNHAIWQECKQAGTLVNAADCPAECDFYFPALIRQGPVVVGVTASGTDHALAREVAARIREDTEQLIPRKEHAHENT